MYYVSNHFGIFELHLHMHFVNITFNTVIVTSSLMVTRSLKLVTHKEKDYISSTYLSTYSETVYSLMCLLNSPFIRHVEVRSNQINLSLRAFFIAALSSLFSASVAIRDFPSIGKLFQLLNALYLMT